MNNNSNPVEEGIRCYLLGVVMSSREYGPPAQAFALMSTGFDVAVILAQHEGEWFREVVGQFGTDKRADLAAESAHVAAKIREHIQQHIDGDTAGHIVDRTKGDPNVH